MKTINIQELIDEAVKARRDVQDGIYDLTDIDFIVFNEEFSNLHEVIPFIEKHKDFWVASAYETQCTILLAAKPNKFKGKQFGSSFNYGSTNILDNCPKRILILAEND